MIKRQGLCLAVAALSLGLAGCAGSGAGWVALVDNGAGMENFDRFREANWQVKDGALHADSGGKEAAHLVTKKSYRDFVLRAEFWASHDANSGIFIRCADPKNITDRNCYEVNIFDQRPDPTYGTGAIVNFAAVRTPYPQAGGQWNSFEITARGDRITVLMNGVQTVDLVNSQLPAGPITLQWGRGVIKFRRVLIQEL